MSKYQYKKKTRDELRSIAYSLLKKFPARRLGDDERAIDIEGILEDLGMEIIFRPMRGIPVEAYLTANPKYVVVNQDAVRYIPRLRFTLAEEVAHKVLEYKLWDSHTLPPGAHVHEMTEAQHRDIEQNAKALAAEILQPEDEFRKRYDFHKEDLAKKHLKRAVTVKDIAFELANDFIVSPNSAAYRAKVLGYVDAKTYDKLFPPLM